MIDIIFLLITFFMVVAAQITEKVDVDIPEASASQSAEDISGRMEISIQDSGQLFLNLTPATIEEIEAAIVENREVPGFALYVRADADAEHADVQEIMQVCAANGVYNIIFATMQ